MRPIVGPREEGDTTKAYRFNWNSPLQFSPHDPATIYLGANYLMRSRDRGMSWEEVGGVDLTKAIDRDELEIMGVPGTEPQMSIHDGTSTYGNITTCAESPLVPGLLYIGTDDGNVQVSRDDGATWQNVLDQVPGLPDRTYVSRVVPSAHAESRVYATFDGHRNGDYAPYAYVSNDYGASWDRITSGLPDGWSVNVITEHHRAPDLLFVGNEVGLFVSVDRGGQWTQLKNNLPVVPVDDILVHPRDNDLLVGTHGRSFWILADVTPLEHLSTEMLAEAGRVFPSQPSTMWEERGDWPFYGATYSAPNPARGARIRYYLRDSVEEHDAAEPGADTDGVGEHDDDDDPGDVGDDDERGDEDASDDDEDEEDGFSLTIIDANGEHVRTLEAPGEAGINEVIWDWRYDRPYEPEEDDDGGGGGGGGFGGGTAQGPIVIPGTYTVSMTVDGQEYSATAEVIAEPRRPMTRADRMARQDALMSLYALAAPIYEATQAAERLGEQLDAAEELLEEVDGPHEDLVEELEAMREEIEAIAEELDIARTNARVANAIQGSSTLPTEDQLWQVDRAWQVLPPAAERLNAIVRTRMPEFNAMLNAQGVRPSVGDTVEIPRRPGG